MKALYKKAVQSPGRWQTTTRSFMLLLEDVVRLPYMPRRVRTLDSGLKSRVDPGLRLALLSIRNICREDDEDEVSRKWPHRLPEAGARVMALSCGEVVVAVEASGDDDRPVHDFGSRPEAGVADTIATSALLLAFGDRREPSRGSQGHTVCPSSPCPAATG